LYDDANDDNDAECQSSRPDVENAADELSMSTLQVFKQTFLLIKI
jgi:hypothetical protein